MTNRLGYTMLLTWHSHTNLTLMAMGQLAALKGVAHHKNNCTAPPQHLSSTLKLHATTEASSLAAPYFDMPYLI